MAKKWSKFWRGLSWTAIIALLLGVLGVVADVTGVLGYFGINLFSTSQPNSSVIVEGDAIGSTIIQSGGGDVNLVQPTTSSGIEAANQVSICMKQHNLPKAHFIAEYLAESDNTNILSTSYFYYCDWPAPPYADPDGYTEIKVEIVPGPDYSFDKPMIELEALTIARIYSSCNELKLGYEYYRQGVGGPLIPFTAYPDTIVDTRGKPWVFSDETLSFGVAGYLGFSPTRNELIVISGLGDNELDLVECIR